MIFETIRKNKMIVLAFLVIAILLVWFFGFRQGRVEGMRDGFYYAEAADFDEHGWKEYVSIYVANNTIITVDYNAKNASGFVKSWDMEYRTIMNASDGTYPNRYTREYAEALLNRQDLGKVDVIAGATHSYTSFQGLVKAAIDQAYAGDTTVVYVDLTGATS